MDGVFTQCRARHPETGRQCVRLAQHVRDGDGEHQDQQARDVYCRRWYDEE